MIHHYLILDPEKIRIPDKKSISLKKKKKYVTNFETDFGFSNPRVISNLYIRA
jgi:hypothetical protein